MKTIKLGLITLFSASLLVPVIVQAGDYEEAVKDANATINKAKAANYEWRDSRKMLNEADKLNKAGKTDEAMKLVAKAKGQGELAMVQAEQQSSVNGPH